MITTSSSRVVLLKRLLLGGWAVWWSIVLASNLADAAKALGLIGASWTFASGNYRFITETTARYGPPSWVNGTLFGGAICWEALAALLFWRAFVLYRSHVVGRPALYAACSAGLSLWLAFLSADEVCIAYDLEGPHARLFVAQLLTLIAIDLLPET